jgi:hypothetical protein
VYTRVYTHYPVHRLLWHGCCQPCSVLSADFTRELSSRSGCESASTTGVWASAYGLSTSLELTDRVALSLTRCRYMIGMDIFSLRYGRTQFSGHLHSIVGQCQNALIITQGSLFTSSVSPCLHTSTRSKRWPRRVYLGVFRSVLAWHPHTRLLFMEHSCGLFDH